MELTVKVPDELAMRARARGMTLETYVEQLLARELDGRDAGRVSLHTSEAVRSWLDSLAQLSDKIPPLPENITREWIYDNHD